MEELIIEDLIISETEPFLTTGAVCFQSPNNIITFPLNCSKNS